MHQTLEQLVKGGVVAVIRANSPEQAEKLALAASKGGIKGLEITFTVPGAIDIIRQLAKGEHDYIVGAGTVLDKETAEEAIEAGAKFIVSPAFDLDTAEFCLKANVPYVAGCLTPTEIVHALKHGVEIIKVFPGSLVGPSYLKDIHGPFPQAKLMPTGGVTLENAKDWIKNGAVAIGTGSYLTAPAKDNDYEEVTRRASLFVEAVENARKELQK